MITRKGLVLAFSRIIRTEIIRSKLLFCFMSFFCLFQSSFMFMSQEQFLRIAEKLENKKNNEVCTHFFPSKFLLLF